VRANDRVSLSPSAIVATTQSHSCFLNCSKTLASLLLIPLLPLEGAATAEEREDEDDEAAAAFGALRAFIKMVA